MGNAALIGSLIFSIRSCLVPGTPHFGGHHLRTLTGRFILVILGDAAHVIHSSSESWAWGRCTVETMVVSENKFRHDIADQTTMRKPNARDQRPVAKA